MTRDDDRCAQGLVRAKLAQVDGAFVISNAGIVLAACRYLDASVEQIDLPPGFGSRHVAAASISHRLGAAQRRRSGRRRSATSGSSPVVAERNRPGT